MRKRKYSPVALWILDQIAAREWTRDQFAVNTGISRRYVDALLRGERTVLGEPTRRRMAERLDLPLASIPDTQEKEKRNV